MRASATGPKALCQPRHVREGDAAAELMVPPLPARQGRLKSPEQSRKQVGGECDDLTVPIACFRYAVIPRARNLRA